MKLFNYMIAVAVILCGAQALAEMDSVNSQKKRSEMNSVKMNDQIHDRKSDRTTMNNQKNAHYSKERIKSAQNKLSDNGYTVSADGLEGQETRKAIKKFQKKENLEVSGRLNPETMQALGVNTDMESSDERTRRPASVKGTQESSDFEDNSNSFDDDSNSEMRDEGDTYDINE